MTDREDKLINVKGIYFAYKRRDVLEDITFSIGAGDFLAIIGPNGSGKSTLIKLILGLLTPSRGEITLFGTPLHHFHQWHLVGYVPQKATHIDPIFPISVAEVVGLGLLAAKRPPRWIKNNDRDIIKEALTDVGMWGLAHRRIGDLSGGQQQRVFIARAIVNQPRILFLDEPTTGIDATAQEDFYNLLDRLNRAGITIVLVTHDIGVVNKYVNKVACLNKRMVFHGTHEEFCSSPRAQALIPGEDHLILHRH